MADKIRQRASASISDHLVDQVIQSARHDLDEGKPADIKLLLRELVERIEVAEEEVRISYTFRNSDTKVARVVAPQVGFEPTT